MRDCQFSSSNQNGPMMPSFEMATHAVYTRSTLRESLSGTFLQTLPELVTPLKGHSLSLRSCPPTRSAPSERFGYWSNSKHRFTTSFLQPCRISYAIGPRKLSANEQFFVGAQTVVSLLQTTQIISDVCFITDHAAYASWNKTTIVWIETELLLFYPWWMRFMFTCVLGR